MKSKLLKIERITGNKATIYGVMFDDIQMNSFEIFLNENKNVFKSELNSIITRLVSIGKITGAREQYFKLNEGIPGDGVCALYDSPDKKLRLYCIRYGTTIVILGGGGKKKVQKFQENKKLKDENYFLRDLSTVITKRIMEGEIWYSDNYMELEGNLEFNDNNNEDES